MAKRVLLADDHALVLEGLSRLLSDHFDVVGAVTSGRLLIEEAERLRPDVVVVDVGMPELNGIEAARRLNRLLPAAKIVFVTQQLDPAYLEAAFHAGAHAYVAKQSASTELVEAIRLALNGRHYVTPLAGSPASALARPDTRWPSLNAFGGKLTPRQREVLQLVAEGKSTKEISAMLRISPKTVEFHRGCLMDELGIRSIAELTRYAIAQGIVNP
jgi:DNA-binding NarL/FixJ family response regulator